MQHPTQFTGGQRQFVARKISAGELSAATDGTATVAEFQGWQDDSTCSGARLRRGLRRVSLSSASDEGGQAGEQGYSGVGARRWSARRGAGCSVRSRRGPCRRACFVWETGKRRRQASLVCELVRGVDSAAVRACVCCKDCLAVNYITPLIKIVLLYHFALPV